MTDTGSLSDGYHTFDELYEHRAALFIAVIKAYPHLAWASSQHDDGSVYPGFFIAGMNLPSGQISYHLPVTPWWSMLVDLGVEFTGKAPPWDGYTPADVLQRIITWIEDSS